MRRALTEQDIGARLDSVPDWAFTANRLERDFEFPDFAQAFGFMASVAVLAQGMDHHPEWSNVYNRVHIALSTHDAGGVSELDFTLAKKIDALLA